MGLIFPNFITKPIIETIAPIFSPQASATKWITEEYLPEILKATEHNDIPYTERIYILTGLAGFLIKIGYAFAFQEQFLKIPGFQDPITIWLGGHFVPAVFGIADNISKFPQTDAAVNESKNVYPGQTHCKYDQGHSIWHEASANGLLDLVFLCDYVNSLVVKYNKKYEVYYNN